MPRLLERVIQRHRSEADVADADRGEAGGNLEARIAVLERRFKHLESLLEGLQDSVHREATRRDRRR